MKFNFGATAFTHPPQGGYIAIDKAPDSFSSVSPIVGSAPAPSKKKAPNAPYAIIIEVGVTNHQHLLLMKYEAFQTNFIV